jgi:hypothetical protein
MVLAVAQQLLVELLRPVPVRELQARRRLADAEMPRQPLDVEILDRDARVTAAVAGALGAVVLRVAGRTAPRMRTANPVFSESMRAAASA